MRAIVIEKEGRTKGQKRWGRQTFSQRSIQDGRYAKIDSVGEWK